MERAGVSVIALFILSLAAAAGQAAPEKILIVGDSLSAAYGLSQKEGWPALLAQRLAAEKRPYVVVNASISGETSHGGRRRIDALLARHRPAVVIIELGANDGLRGLPLSALADNLAHMIERSQAAGARVLLVGMLLPPNYGPRYTQAFQRIYRDLAARYGTALTPFLLDGLGTGFTWFQRDGLHPTAAAQPMLLDNVWRELKGLLN
ncbi:MAG TPA: arylesterase [Gammaproteobacteria bacterium]|nr:arylesterase [Gammaproteobacteria bacterium]